MCSIYFQAHFVEKIFCFVNVVLNFCIQTLFRVQGVLKQSVEFMVASETDRYFFKRVKL